MAHENASAPEPEIDGLAQRGRLSVYAVFGIALAVTLLHLATNGRYGFHRDELQFLSDARHLDWGFVAYPPLTPFLERIGLQLFGLSLVGLRLFSVLAQAAVLVLTGMMVRDLGGKSLAQATAVLAVALSPLPLFQGTEFQYSSFDLLWWVLISYFTLRLLVTGNPRWWLAIGASIGLGLQTKYSILFCIAGILVGVLFTRARRFLVGPWFWAGVALALLIFLPNFLWQIRHGFISYHFLQHIHARDVGQGRAGHFFRDQFLICVNLCAVPLVLAGIVAAFRSRQFRMLGWMYLAPLVLFAMGKGRGYYLAPAYPVLLAFGAVAAQNGLAALPRWADRTLKGALLIGITVWGILVCAVILPLAASGPLRNFTLSQNGDLREEFGWNDLVRTVAAVRDTLPPEQQGSVGILVGNYGEQGAIELLGAPYHLPAPISMTNSAWLRGYPAQPPTTLIVLGFSQQDADKAFTGCRLAAHNGNSENIKNEESEAHPDIFVCGAPRLAWPAFWKEYQSFG